MVRRRGASRAPGRYGHWSRRRTSGRCARSSPATQPMVEPATRGQDVASPEGILFQPQRFPECPLSVGSEIQGAAQPVQPSGGGRREPALRQSRPQADRSVLSHRRRAGAAGRGFEGLVLARIRGGRGGGGRGSVNARSALGLRAAALCAGARSRGDPAAVRGGWDRRGGVGARSRRHVPGRRPGRAGGPGRAQQVGPAGDRRHEMVRVQLLPGPARGESAPAAGRLRGDASPGNRRLAAGFLFHPQRLSPPCAGPGVLSGGPAGSIRRNGIHAAPLGPVHNCLEMAPCPDRCGNDRGRRRGHRTDTGIGGAARRARSRKSWRPTTITAGLPAGRADRWPERSGSSVRVREAARPTASHRSSTKSSGLGRRRPAG